MGKLCGMNTTAKVYRIRRTEEPPAFTGNWCGGVWAAAESAPVDHFHPSSSDHRPKAAVKILYDAGHLYVFFRVNDRYVRAVAEGFQGPVWADSCAEAFLRPREHGGYFNFEMNCGGTLLLYYIEDPRRTEEGFVKFTPVAAEQIAGMRIYHSLPTRVDPEIAEPVEWRLEYSIPLSIFEAYLGEAVDPADHPADRRWRGNFYKCGDRTSHPHWASWSPIGEELNFHCPEHFGILEFAE
jgi:hypothetical protein